MKMDYFLPKDWKKEEKKLLDELIKKGEQFYIKYEPKKPKLRKIF